MPAPTAAVTLVLGEEELLAERAVGEAVAAAVGALGPATTVEEVRAGALPDGFAVDLATASLFGDGRVVVVQEAEGLDATARAAVLAAARDPHPGTVLVLRAAGAGRQGKFFKDLGEHARVVPAQRLKPSERAKWLRDELRRLDRQHEAALVSVLLDTVGSDLRELAGAVAKLHVAVPPPAELTAAHASRFLTPTAERAVWELSDAALGGDVAAALARLDSLLAQGQSMIGLVSMLARQVRLLLLVSEQSGAPRRQIAAAAGIPEWQVDRARRQARRFRPEDLRRSLDMLAQLEAEVHNGSLPHPQRLALELAVARLATAARG